MGFVEASFRGLAARGPNSRGWIGWEPAGRAGLTGEQQMLAGLGGVICHTRLSILDVTDCGYQPMISPCRSKLMSFNGEIYNFLSLRSELEAQGEKFDGSGDSEVLFRWLCVHGPAGIARLDGMFAFVFVDLQAQTLLLARDEYGIKPLYFRQHGGDGFAFASTPAVLADQLFGGVTSNLEAAVGFLRYGAPICPTEETLFKEILPIRPGECARLDLRTLTLTRERWCREYKREMDPGRSAESLVDDIRSQFLADLRSSLVADVPLGVALSGGLDSSALLFGMKKLAVGPGPIWAFSHVEQNEPCSEENWIDFAALEAGARLVKVRTASEAITAGYDQLLLVHGEPFCDSSIYSEYAVFKAAREHGVKVILNGQGVDEFMAGYDHYAAILVMELVRSGRLLEAAAILQRLYRYGSGYAATLIVSSVKVVCGARNYEVLTELIGKAALPGWVRLGTSAGRYHEDGERLQKAHSEGLGASLEWSVRNGLVNLCRYADRSSMACSVECRVPFLRAGISRSFSKVPVSLLYGPQGESKHLLRRALEGIVPPRLLARRDKVGFANNESKRLLQSAALVEMTLAGVQSGNIIDLPALRKAWLAFKRRPLDNGQARRIWSSISYLRWIQLFKVGSA